MAKGAGSLLSIDVRALTPNPEAQISILSMSPIGSEQPVGKPLLPQKHLLAIVP
jgi:hypothetical protein